MVSFRGILVEFAMLKSILSIIMSELNGKIIYSQCEAPQDLMGLSVKHDPAAAAVNNIYSQREAP